MPPRHGLKPVLDSAPDDAPMNLRMAAVLAVLAWCAGALIEAPAPRRFVQEDLRIPVPAAGGLELAMPTTSALAARPQDDLLADLWVRIGSLVGNHAPSNCWITSVAERVGFEPTVRF
jgi:hypothetical protein